MAKSQNPRKSLEQVLEESDAPEFKNEHIDKWNYGKSADPFKAIERDLPIANRKLFNIAGAILAPKSIRYRQMREPFLDIGKPGDYLFVDRMGNKMILPYILFKRLF